MLKAKHVKEIGTDATAGVVLGLIADNVSGQLGHYAGILGEIAFITAGVNFGAGGFDRSKLSGVPSMGGEAYRQRYGASLAGDEEIDD